MAYREAPETFPIVVCATGDALLGLDRRTGARVWQQSLAEHGGILRLAFVGEHVIVAFRRALGRVDARSGKVLWVRPVDIIPDTLLVDGAWIVTGCSGRVACFDLDGTPMWRDDLKGLGIAPVALGVPGCVSNPDMTG